MSRTKKVVLLTGASAGIGESSAKKLLSEGYVVYGAARRVEKMASLKEMGVHTLAMDVTDEISMADGVTKIVAEQGRIDVLVNNAGYGSYGAIEDVPLEEARRQFEVNIFGLARLTQLVLPHMREHKFGRIINISSMGGKVYTPLGGWYHATKHALEGFSDCLRLETQQFGIDVVIIQPGSIKSEWNQIAIDSMKKASGESAYREFTQKVVNMFERETGKGSSPELIADLISKAISAKKPKTRYVAGYMAKPSLFMRAILSDRMFDKALLSQMK